MVLTAGARVDEVAPAAPPSTASVVQPRAAAAAAAADCEGNRDEPGGRDPWGGCWPGSSNTGVPPGTVLKRVGGDPVIAKDGAVVDGWDVDGCLVVSGLGVTIRNTRADCITLPSNSRARYCHASEGAAVRRVTECTVVPGLSDASGARDRRTRLTVRDSTIDCGGEPGTGLGDRNMVVVRVEILGCVNGFDADSFITVRNSYIHDLYNEPEGDPHTDGIQSGVAERLRIVHNVIFGFTTGCKAPAPLGCNGTSALILGGQPDLATARHTLIRRNLLAGGAYTLYCPNLPPTDFAIVENRFSEIYSPKVGEYGAMTGCGRPGVVRQGNKRVHY